MSSLSISGDNYSMFTTTTTTTIIWLILMKTKLALSIDIDTILVRYMIIIITDILRTINIQPFTSKLIRFEKDTFILGWFINSYLLSILMLIILMNIKSLYSFKLITLVKMPLITISIISVAMVIRLFLKLEWNLFVAFDLFLIIVTVLAILNLTVFRGINPLVTNDIIVIIIIIIISDLI